MEDSKIRAKRLLVHYFKQVFEKSGLHWDSDNIFEIEEIVDEIVNAAENRIRKSELFDRHQ